MKIGRLWKEILRGLRPTGEVDSRGEATWESVRKDPSLTRQLADRAGMSAQDRLQAYLDACRLAPGASASTRRKWRQQLGLD